MRTILILSVVCALTLAGCASNSNTSTTPTSTTTTSTPTTSTTPTPGANTTVQVLSYTATQDAAAPNPNSTYNFTGPSTAQPGWTLVKLTNEGKEGHQIVFTKLPAGETLASHMAMMANNSSMGDAHAKAIAIGGVATASPPPAGVTVPGGASPLNSTSYAWVKLEEGTYVLECDIPGPGGPHATHGMIKELVVSGAMSAAPEPTAQLSVTTVDFNFTWSATPTAATTLVKVQNTGSMPHEVVIVHLLPGKKVQDFLAWEHAPQGPPPITDSFGAGALSPGQTEYIVTNFQSLGDYGIICFLPDAMGAPHFTHGMVQQIHIA